MSASSGSKHEREAVCHEASFLVGTCFYSSEQYLNGQFAKQDIHMASEYTKYFGPLTTKGLQNKQQ